VASVNTWSDTHAAIATAALRNGAHVFVEKRWPARSAESSQSATSCVTTAGR
jgi:hypothetical protein